MTRMKLLSFAAILAATATGCAGPRIVTSMSTTRDGKFRVLYSRQLGMGGVEQGIIDCQAGEGGTLSNCAPITVAFADQEKKQ